MTLLTKKLGYNETHNTSDFPHDPSRVERVAHICKLYNLGYIRFAYRLIDSEVTNGVSNEPDNGYRAQQIINCQKQGLDVVMPCEPSYVYNHLLDDNADALIQQVSDAYADIFKGLVAKGVDPNHMIIEAWNEADGTGFGTTDGNVAVTNEDYIRRYQQFNQNVCQSAKAVGFKFLDIDSIYYPQYPSIQKNMNMLNDRIPNYTSKPDALSFHPYCNQKHDETRIPENLLVNNNFRLNNYENLKDIPFAVSEFGFPTVDGAKPFIGSIGTQYGRELLIREIIVLDYLNVNPIIIYSGKVNTYNVSDTNADACWGLFQQYKTNDGQYSIKLSELGKYELQWLEEMQGYYLSNCLSPTDLSSLTYDNVGYKLFAFEYTNDSTNTKKLIYWCPYGDVTQTVNWNGSYHKLHATFRVRSITEKAKS